MFDMTNDIWYKQSDPSKQLYSVVNKLMSDLSPIMYKNDRHAKLYLNDIPIDNNFFAFNTFSNVGLVRQPRLSLNVVKSAADSLLAKICKNKVKPMFLTDGGSYAAHVKAQQLNKFVNGLFYQTDFHKKARITKRDEFIFGLGAAYFYKEEYTDPRTGKKRKRVQCERVYPDEILVDLNESRYGEPRNMYRYRFLPKNYLKELYPEYRSDIDRAKAETFYVGQSFQDCVMVFEAWHLPMNKQKGRHVLAIETCTFVDEDYNREKFPFVFSRYSENILGFYAIGVAEELFSIQSELNRILFHTQKAMRLSANPKIFIEESSSINPMHLTNDEGIIIKYRGNPPIYATNPSVHPDQFQQIESLYQKAFQIIGLSQLTAQGQKPAGLDSGKALDTYHDIETERFSQTARAFEDFHIETANLMVDLVQEIVEEDGTYEVTSFSRKEGMERIDFADIQIDRDGYVMQCFPISDLPSTPAGKLKFVQEMAASQFIDPGMALELLDFPDTDHAMQLQLAPLRILMRNIEKMLESGIYLGPEPEDDLNLAMKLTNQYYHWARLKNIEDSKLQLLRDYYEAAKTLLNPPQPPAPPLPPIDPMAAMVPPPGLPPMPVDPLMQPPMPPMPAS